MVIELIHNLKAGQPHLPSLQLQGRHPLLARRGLNWPSSQFLRGAGGEIATPGDSMFCGIFLDQIFTFIFRN